MAYPFIDLCPCPSTAKCSEDIYCGPPLVVTGINNGDTLVVALQKIEQALSNIVNPTTTTTTTIP